MTGTPLRRKTGAPVGTLPPKKPIRRFELDRVIALRVALVVIVVLFLYTILRVSMIAFGGSANRETKRIERAMDTSAVPTLAPAAPQGNATPNPARPAP